MCMFRRSSSGQITNHLSPWYCRSPWHQFAKDYSAYYCGFNNTTARYTTSLARRCCYLIPCQELIQRTMSDQPQNQRWSASTPLTSFLFQTTSSKELQRETACDPTLQFSKKAILDGFPGTKEKQPAAIHQYFEIRDELSVHGGVIFKGQRCIITQTLRQKIKQKLHDSHIGSQVQHYYSSHAEF